MLLTIFLEFFLLFSQTFAYFCFNCENSFIKIFVIESCWVKHCNHRSEHFNSIIHIIFNLAVFLPTFALRLVHSKDIFVSNLHLMNILSKPNPEYFEALLIPFQVFTLNFVICFKISTFIGFSNIQNGKKLLHLIIRQPSKVKFVSNSI